MIYAFSEAESRIQDLGKGAGRQRLDTPEVCMYFYLTETHRVRASGVTPLYRLEEGSQV